MPSDNDKKGFAGLESMVSDIEMPSPPPTKTETHSEPVKDSAPAPQVYQGQPSSPSGSGKWWAIGIGILILAIWAGGFGSKISSRDPSYVAPAPAPAPSYGPPAYASDQEEIPPVGSGILFGRNQIRYCLSEKIRIEAWSSKVNEYSGSSVDAFNFAVNDYNARCSNFRYHSGSLESVRTEVEANRYSLAAEGMRKALLNP